MIAEVWCADAAGSRLGSITREWPTGRLSEGGAADGRHATNSTLAARQHQVRPGAHCRLAYCRRGHQDLTVSDWLTVWLTDCVFSEHTDWVCTATWLTACRTRTPLAVVVCMYICISVCVCVCVCVCARASYSLTQWISRHDFTAMS